MIRTETAVFSSRVLKATAVAMFAAGVAGVAGYLPAAIEAQTRPASGAVPNLSGIWMRAGGAVTPKELPLNARGIALREAIDESLAPMYDCVPATIPHILGDPYNFSIEQRNDRVIIKFEKDAVTRTVWLDGHKHPAATNNDYALHGYSVGRYEDGQLVVETTKYTFDPGGLEDKPPMVPSTTMKKTIERYRRDGDRLMVEVTLEDRLILKEPVVFKFQFTPTKEALVEWPECDPVQARAPIDYMPVNQLKYGIR
jgi:hypothetical protein